MVKCSLQICVIILSVNFLFIAAENAKCEICVPKEKCPLFEVMNKQEQEKWIIEFSCQNSHENDFISLEGFSTVAKGDYVCCHNSTIWGIEDGSNHHRSKHQTNRPPNNNRVIYDRTGSQQYNQNQEQKYNHELPNSNIRQHNNNNWQSNDFRNAPNVNILTDYNHGSDKINQNSNHRANRYPSNDNKYRQNARSQNIQSNFNTNGNDNINFDDSPRRGRYPQQNNDRSSFNMFNRNIPEQNQRPESPLHTINSYYKNPYPPSSNSYFSGVNSNGNSFGRTNLGEQCAALTSFPPEPATGCCGRDVSDTDRIAVSQTAPSFDQPARNLVHQRWAPQEEFFPPPQNEFNWPPFIPLLDFPNSNVRFKRSAEKDAINITLDNRIAGGKNTELEQYPWTVLLKTTFDYGTKESKFNCGGSIISSRYVLTAAHCIYEEGATVSDVEIYLSEYDKRTFPMDCVKNLGEERKCIENIVMHAEEVISHPEYDDARLQNDIALLRLRGKAPYTDYIRPICLPTFDIDNPDFSNLHLEVAGWGRNGNQVSEIKQSTTINLVPQRDCMRHYPHLTRRHLCAAGYSGEDTCKGDSGGPLMMVYDGKYFVSGIVSGKRADFPCGTSVPSLYTNVFHYLQWIRNNMRN